MNPTPTDIPTPRTDAELYRIIHNRPAIPGETLDQKWVSQWNVLAIFARTLERENFTLREENNYLKLSAEESDEIMSALTKERDDLKTALSAANKLIESACNEATEFCRQKNDLKTELASERARHTSNLVNDTRYSDDLEKTILELREALSICQAESELMWHADSAIAGMRSHVARISDASIFALKSIPSDISAKWVSREQHEETVLKLSKQLWKEYQDDILAPRS